MMREILLTATHDRLHPSLQNFYKKIQYVIQIALQQQRFKRMLAYL
jgi:hypothetical protein